MTAEPAPDGDDRRDGAEERAAARVEGLQALLAHELSTPLAVIGTAADLALAGDDIPADERRRLLEMIRRNTDVAKDLLRRLSLARQVDAGTLSLEPAEVALEPLVRETVDDLRHIVLTNHAVEVAVDAQPMVLVDPAATREILFNLLSNAAKYSAADAAIAVTVSAADGMAEVIVRNHGTGVTPGDTERIFGRFEQGDQGSPGAGLGLYVSRGLARAQGGELQVRPAEDVGSEFHLTVPITVS